MRARENAAQPPQDQEALSFEETRRMLHELQVHQIELELQNVELREAQAALEASRARYFDLYDLAPVGYCTLSEKGLILEANLTAATLLGVVRGILIKHVLSQFIIEEHHHLYFRLRKQIFEAGTPQACELRMVKQDGTTFWAHLKAAAARNDDGAPVCRVVINDITAHKRAEAEKESLEAQSRQLQKCESLGRMAGAIAHHFNNQLLAVMMNLEMAMNDLPQKAAPGGNLTEAMQAARKAAEVSGLMLIYLGQTVAKREPLDLSEACEGCLSLLRAAMPKSVVLDTDLPRPGPAINANANQIQQVLTNLVTNAWEAMGEAQGAIRLTVKRVSTEDIPVAHCFPTDWKPHGCACACLEVADAGCGIGAKDIEKLFDPFFSSKFIGRGMGLPVVLGIVRAHDGGVTMASEPGRGSVFRVFLPVSEQAVLRKPNHDAPVPRFRGEGTMLLVEDEMPLRQVVARTLLNLGFTVLAAKDGVEALEVFREHRDEIRCVLCDLSMPRMNGWETLRALRELSPGLPVILSSGYNEAQVMAGQHPECEPPQAFLRKPYETEKLINALSQAMARGKGRT